MSVENGKVCCNCRHNIRKCDFDNYIRCYCEIDNEYLSYNTVMTGWCRHWAKKDDIMEWLKKWAEEVSNESTDNG